MANDHLTPDQKKSLDALDSMGRELTERWAQRSSRIIDRLDTKPVSEHNHRLVLLAVGIVGVVIPIFAAQTGSALLPIRLAGAVLPLSAIVLLAWDVFAPIYRRPVSASVIDFWTDASKAEWNRNAIRIHHSFGQASNAQEYPRRQKDLDTKEHTSRRLLSDAHARMTKIDSIWRAVSYVLLIAGLGLLLWAILIISPADASSL